MPVNNKICQTPGGSLTDCLIREVRKETPSSEQPKTNLIWLELTGCSGNIISLMNGNNPDFHYLITRMVNLIYSNSLMSAEGEAAIRKLKSAINTPFILAVEGAVATANNGLYNIIGTMDGKPLTALEAVKSLGERATHVIVCRGICLFKSGTSEPLHEK